MINRVIPCLLIQNDSLVKTIKFKDTKYVGDPINTLKIFNEKEVDEILVLDIEASKNDSEANYELIGNFASECFMPLSYGGGISSIDQAHKIFDLGVEKISLNSMLLNDLNEVKKICEEFGSQAVIASIDICKNYFGRYKIFNSKIKKIYNCNLDEFIDKVIDAGVGEIILNAIYKDGTMEGMDTNLIELVNKRINIPLISIGGVGSLEDIKNGILAGSDAISAGSFFVFNGPHRAVLITYPKYENLSKLLIKN